MRCDRECSDHSKPTGQSRQFQVSGRFISFAVATKPLAGFSIFGSSENGTKPRHS